MSTLDDRYRRALEAAVGGRYRSAQEILTESLSAHPRAAQTIYLLGVTLLLRGQWALARTVIDRAYAVKPWLRDLSPEHIDLTEAAANASAELPDWDWPDYELERHAFLSVGLSLPVVVNEHLARESVTFVEIGANDGRDHDPIYAHVVRHRWSGVAVEPVPETFERLLQTYADNDRVQCVQAAISDSDGEVTIHQAANSKLASLVPDRNALRGVGTGQALTVPSMRVQTLLERTGLTTVDLVQIDTEGYDFHVLRQFDLAVVRPLAVHMEFYCLPISERLATFALLRSNGYAYRFDGMDLIAIDRSRAAASFCLADITNGAHLRSVVTRAA